MVGPIGRAVGCYEVGSKSATIWEAHWINNKRDYVFLAGHDMREEWGFVPKNRDPAQGVCRESLHELGAKWRLPIDANA